MLNGVSSGVLLRGGRDALEKNVEVPYQGRSNQTVATQCGKYLMPLLYAHKDQEAGKQVDVKSLS